MAIEEKYAAEAGLPYEQDPNFRIVSICLLATACCGVIGNTFIGYLFYRYEKLRTHPSNLLVLALCLGDAIMCFPRLIEVPIELANYGFPASYHPLCQVLGGLTYFSAYLSGNTLTAVSMERYFSIVRGVTITRRQCLFIAIGIWAIAFAIAIVLPILTAIGKGTPRSPYILQASGMYCLINWGDSSPYGRTQTVVALTTILTVVGTIGGGYFMIWRHVQSIARITVVVSDTHGLTTVPMARGSKDQAATSGNRQTTSSTMSTLERNLMWKGVIMSLAFVVNWLPYTVMIFYEALLARHDISPAFCAASWFGSLLNSAINPILFISLDTRVLSCARQAIGLRASPTDSQPSSAAGSKLSGGGGNSTAWSRGGARPARHRALSEEEMPAELQDLDL
ncbi:hypothetical protein HDU86_003142 [Geranomyces michiganensis]|nr:hypothetical protein HDU86_003142 [Geranomyces michiganensis]